MNQELRGCVRVEPRSFYPGRDTPCLPMMVDGRKCREYRHCRVMRNTGIVLFPIMKKGYRGVAFSGRPVAFSDTSGVP